jgi:hypothetical protein
VILGVKWVDVIGGIIFTKHGISINHKEILGELLGDIVSANFYLHSIFQGHFEVACLLFVLPNH